jgi:peptidoglycan/xylan/chitin deacetylase (PgdA/CDA1 family)
VSEARVALTFDAEHPSRGRNRVDAVTEMLDALTAAGVRATFFVQGRWATAYPETARRIANDGHVVGNHSNYHARLTMLSPDGIVRDVAEAEERIAETTGMDPKPWFRCPFGDGADRPKILDALAALGYRDVRWDVDTADWHPATAAADVVQAVIGGLAAPRSDPLVVMQHTWSASSADALPELLARLRSDGAGFATIEEVTVRAV